jgi:hypothetical protein
VFQKILDSVPDDVKLLLQKFPAILRTGDVKPTHNLCIPGVNHQSGVTFLRYIFR